MPVAPSDGPIQWPVGRDLWFLVLLALLPILGYQFGVGNQIEQFSLVQRVLDPGFIRGDFFVDSSVGFGPRYYFVRVVAALASVTSVPAAVLLLALGANVALAVITWAAARTLLATSRLGGALAATLAITNPGFALGLAAFLRFDSFQPANLAVPLGLAGVLLLLTRGRAMGGAVLLTLASMMHPLIGAELAALGFVAAAVMGPRDRRRLLVLPAVLTILLTAAAWAGPRLLAPARAEPAADLFGIMATFRAPHHYLASTFPVTHYIAFGLFLVAVCLLGRRHIQTRGWTTSTGALAVMTLGVLLLCLGSAFFVDVRHSSLWVMAQPFRMLLLIKWVGYLVIGSFLADVMAEDRRTGWALATAVLLAPAEVQAVVILLAAGIAVCPMQLQQRARILFPIGLGVVVLLVIWRLGAENEAIRPLVALFALGMMFVARTKVAPILATAGVASLLLLAAANRSEGLLDLRAFRPTFSWSDVVTPAAEAARWARANTAESSVWVIPPEVEMFRLVAHRPVVVDFTSIPLSNGGMIAWRERMTAVYGEVRGGGFSGLREMQQRFRAGDGDGVAQAAQRFGATHALLYAETPWVGKVLFQNGMYKIVAL